MSEKRFVKSLYILRKRALSEADQRTIATLNDQTPEPVDQPDLLARTFEGI